MHIIQLLISCLIFLLAAKKRVMHGHKPSSQSISNLFNLISVNKDNSYHMTLVPYSVHMPHTLKFWKVNGYDFSDTVLFSKFAQDMQKLAELTGYFLVSSDYGDIHRFLLKLNICLHSNKEAVKTMNVEFLFDNKFNLIQIHVKYLDKYGALLYEKDNYHPVELVNELLMIRLAVQDKNSELAQLFPEFRNRSAYDFSSENFKKRLLIADILDY